MVHVLVWILFGLLIAWASIFTVLAIRPTETKMSEQEYAVMTLTVPAKGTLKQAVSSGIRTHAPQSGDVETLSAM